MKASASERETAELKANWVSKKGKGASQSERPPNQH